MAIADRSCGLLRKVNCGSGTPYVFRTEVPANGNGRQVRQSSLQGELRKWNTLSVVITELQANGNGGHVTQPPSHCGSGTPYVFITEVQVQTGHAASSAQKRNALCVLITELQANGNGRQVMRPPPQTELPKQNAIRVFIMANGNGRKVMWPPPQSELQKRNAICDHYGKWKWQTGHAASAK